MARSEPLDTFEPEQVPVDARALAIKMRVIRLRVESGWTVGHARWVEVAFNLITLIFIAKVRASQRVLALQIWPCSLAPHSWTWPELMNYDRYHIVFPSIAESALHCQLELPTWN